MTTKLPALQRTRVRRARAPCAQGAPARAGDSSSCPSRKRTKRSMWRAPPLAPQCVRVPACRDVTQAIAEPARDEPTPGSGAVVTTCACGVGGERGGEFEQ